MQYCVVNNLVGGVLLKSGSTTEDTLNRFEEIDESTFQHVSGEKYPQNVTRSGRDQPAQ